MLPSVSKKGDSPEESSGSLCVLLSLRASRVKLSTESYHMPQKISCIGTSQSALEGGKGYKRGYKKG